MAKKDTSIKANRAALKKAQSRLDANARSEKRRGIRDETATYRRRNAAVGRAAAKVPWWAR